MVWYCKECDPHAIHKLAEAWRFCPMCGAERKDPRVEIEFTASGKHLITIAATEEELKQLLNGLTYWLTSPVAPVETTICEVLRNNIREHIALHLIKEQKGPV